jgi:hypothetical protein
LRGSVTQARSETGRNVKARSREKDGRAVTEDHITPEHLDATLETFRGRVYRASMERAIAEVRGWRRRLEETGDLDLASIAENLGELETLLAADHLDAGAVGQLLSELGEQTVKVGGSGVPEAVDEKLQRLGGLLDADGRMLRVLSDRKDTLAGG